MIVVVQPTPEQRYVLGLAGAEQNIALHAFAGTGKTTTLRMLSECRGGSGLYLAFNRSIASEARSSFPSEVDCRTIHSLAWRALEKTYGASRLGMPLFPRALVERMHKRPLVLGTGPRSIRLDPIHQASIIVETLRKFCHSADAVIDASHVPTLGRLQIISAEDRTSLRDWACRGASLLWKLIVDPNRTLPISHDAYLKIWALGEPKLKARTIMLDEAQDTNPVVLDLLRRQDAVLIVTGDAHQQIYAWRGAVDAMAQFGGRSAYLTQSFRFGPAIADAATAVLRTLGETRPLVGNPDVDSRIVAEGRTKAVLARTNVMLFYLLLQAQAQGRTVHLLGGDSELLDILRDVEALQSGRPANKGDLLGYRNWQEVVRWSQLDEGRSLRPLVSIVRQHRVARLIDAVEAAGYGEEEADVVLSTAHKAKGRQWSSVAIAPDFSKIRDGVVDASEIRLFYVAITRAQRMLVIDPNILRDFMEGGGAGLR